MAAPLAAPPYPPPTWGCRWLWTSRVDRGDRGGGGDGYPCTRCLQCVRSPLPMGETNDNQREAIDPLRLDRCPECGYLLTGLPPTDVCPECGLAYDQQMIVLRGFMSATNWDRVQSRMFAVVMFAVAALGSTLLCRFLPFRVPFWLPVVVGPMIVCSFFWLYSVRRRDPILPDAPVRVQLRLTPEGFGCRHGYGPCSLTPWRGVLKVSICGKRYGKYLLQVSNTTGSMPLIGRHTGFVFRSDDRTVQLIRGRISHWRHHSIPSHCP